MKKISKINKLIFLSVVLGCSFCALGSSVDPRQASAVTGGDFNAARIIDDAVFFNPTSMSSQEIQLFLNSKLGVCDTNGTQPYAGTTRAAYGTSRGYPPPYTCLKDYSQAIPTKSPDAYCSGTVVGGTKSSSQIVYDVAQACSVSPKVLLILLQKEQSLVTDDWPWSVQYRSATGYGCPDTAPCDAEYYGFFNQVYMAARQYQRYSKQADLYNYRANRTNFIQYHPNAACGGSNIFIQNQATAGLYNYTPYQPNSAALNNLYGTGDGCSSYGNRNFWRMYNDWFGSVNGPAYTWQYVSLSAFSDASRTRSFSNVISLQPGQTGYIRLKAKNMGYLPWSQGSVRVGTANPRDRTSPFYSNSWINSVRPATTSEQTVNPSETGTFDFAITAPATPGTYRENIGMVAEGLTWFPYTIDFTVNVVTPIAAPTPSVTTLTSGNSISANQYMLSPDKQSILRPQSDGNLVLYSDFNPVWYTGTAGQRPAKNLIMQSDGNLVLYDTNNLPLWNSQTQGNPGAYLALQIDGNLVIYSGGGVPLWTTNSVHNPDYLSYVNTTLHTSKLYPGQQIQTPDRKYRLILQGDGNLVLYLPYRHLWASGTDGKDAAFLAMQSDGHLVLYDKQNKPLWYSFTAGRGVSALVMQQDGNLVIYDGLGRPTWNTQTNGLQ